MSMAVIVPNIFYCRYLVVKIQSSSEFQNSILHLFHFNSPYFIASVDVLLVLHYPLEKHLKKDICSVLFTLELRFTAI